jgi:hypothetical protein
MDQDKYWYRICPRCKQGGLVITEDITHNRLYLHCNECEIGFIHPEESDDVSKGFETYKEDFDTRIPSLDRIREFGWSAYAKHRLDG